MRKWSDLAIGVKTSQHGLLTHNAAYALEFFLDALLENELAADAADENRQFRGGAPRRETAPRRADGAVHQPVDVGFGETRMGTLRNISREGHALSLLVDSQYG